MKQVVENINICVFSYIHILHQMGKKQSDVTSRQSKKERKKDTENDKSIYTTKHIRAKEALICKKTHVLTQVNEA